MKKNQKKTGEFEMIRRIRRMAGFSPDVLKGIGDDTAVLKGGPPDEVLLWTVDHVVEGVHFDGKINDRAVGRKALARSLSDIAAMGGKACYATVCLGLPDGFSAARVHRFYEGFFKLAREYNIKLVGGDITKSPSKFFSSVAVLGKMPSRNVVLRSGAKPGDLIFVTGSLGGSIFGKHVQFQPCLKEGQWLAENRIATAMIDVSDGLAGDLGHILEESRVGACLEASKIPVSRDAIKLFRRDGKSAVKHALSDGEDYELLFTCRFSNTGWVSKFRRIFDTNISCIGFITSEKKEILLHDGKGKIQKIFAQGYAHF